MSGAPLTDNAQRKALAREAERRRQGATTLRVAADGALYAALVLMNGSTPAQARGAALEAAGELVATAEALQRAVRLNLTERRQVAAQLAAVGLGTKAIADRASASGPSGTTSWAAAGIVTPVPMAARGAIKAQVDFSFLCQLWSGEF